MNSGRSGDGLDGDDEEGEGRVGEDAEKKAAPPIAGTNPW